MALTLPEERLPVAEEAAPTLPKLENGAADQHELNIKETTPDAAKPLPAALVPNFQRYQPPLLSQQPLPQPNPAPEELKPANPGPLAKTQTVFIHKLYDMLEDPTLSHLIWWSPTNDSFCLYPGEEFLNVLAQYFKHTNIASFIRQLNMYGFHKVNDSFQTDEKTGLGLQAPPSSTSSSGQSQTRWEFRHAANQFRKGDVELLRLIKRKLLKVVATQKEIVSLKLLPPTSNPSLNAGNNSSAVSAIPQPPSDTEAQDSPENAQKQQYHRSLYQQSWKQQLGNQQPVLKPHTPSSPKGHLQNSPAASGQVYYPGHPVHAYPGFIHAMPVPLSPSLPQYPDQAMPTPSSYVSQSQLRQPSNQTALGVDQLINLKLIEMSTAIANLRAAYDDLQRRHEHLNAGYTQSQHEMVMLVDILEKQALREPEERAKTPTSASTPGLDLALALNAGISDLKAFKKQILSRLSKNGPVSENHENRSHEQTNSSSSIVPQHYPLNPNYSLYNSAENGFRHFRLGSDELHQQNRHFSVLMDPLQPKAFKAGEDSKSTTPLPAPTAKDLRSQMPIQYQPKISQLLTPALYLPYIREEGPHQQRTVSLPILDKAMPPALSHQRHSTTTLPGVSDERRPSSPGRSLPMGHKALTLNPMKTTMPLGLLLHSRSSSPVGLGQPQTHFGMANEPKSALPSVKELDMLIKRSSSGRLSDILTHDSDVRAKKKKLE